MRPTVTSPFHSSLLEAATTINLPKQINQAADHLISRFFGSLNSGSSKKTTQLTDTDDDMREIA
jgi:hypothetical protein